MSFSINYAKKASFSRKKDATKDAMRSGVFLIIFNEPKFKNRLISQIRGFLNFKREGSCLLETMKKSL